MAGDMTAANWERLVAARAAQMNKLELWEREKYEQLVVSLATK